MNDIAEQSAAALLNDLTPEEHAAWAALLAHDPEAQALHEEFTAMNETLASHHAAAAPPPNFEQRMVGAFRRRAARTPFAARIASWLRLPVLRAAALAAIAAALVWLGAVLTREPARPAETDLAATLSAASKTDVDRLLAEATTFFESARYDLAYKRCEQALAIDKYSIPARRLIEKVDAARGRYANSAYSSTRGKLIATVDAGWELPTRKIPASPDAPANSAAPQSKSNAPADAYEFFAKNDDGQFGGFINYGSPVLSAAGQVEVTPNVINQPIFSARKLVREARADLVVAAFEPAAKSIVELAVKSGGYLATRDSSLLANGKMSGTLVVKIPPPALDGFLTQLAPLGELRNQSLGTEDVTKAYFDTDARLRNARKMEERLIDLLANTKGRVSDLLEVERELGRVRGQIEEMQGQLKHWDSLAAYATVTIRLAEKDLSEAAAYTLREQIVLKLVSPNVAKSYERARAIAEESKAQVTDSALAQDGDRTVGTLNLLLDAAAADAAIAQLRTLGRVAEFRRDAQRIARGGGGDAPGARVERERVRVSISISSQDEAPVQQTELEIETANVATQAAALREFAAARKIEIKESTFDQQTGAQTARLRFSLPLAGYESFLARIQSAGPTKDFSSRRNATRTLPDAERAEISVTLAAPPRLVASQDGLAPTLRHTFGQAAASLMWSIRMIGVALAFLAPWLLGLAAILAIVRAIRRRKTRA